MVEPDGVDPRRGLRRRSLIPGSEMVVMPADVMVVAPAMVVMGPDMMVVPPAVMPMAPAMVMVRAVVMVVVLRETEQPRLARQYGAGSDGQRCRRGRSGGSEPDGGRESQAVGQG